MFRKASEAVEAQRICASTAFDASTAEQQPLIHFFSRTPLTESLLLSIEYNPAIRGRRFTQVTCNMMQKWTLCFNIVFWSERLDGARAKTLAGINCNPRENNGDISGLL